MKNHYLDARVSLMASRLLGDDDLSLLTTGNDADRAAVLARAGLGSLLADEEAGRYLEQSIVRSHLDDLLILMRAAGDGRPFLQYWGMRFELSNLKAIVRAKLSGAPIADVRQSLIDLGFLASLPTEALLRTEDVGELLRRLEATRYADMVRFARRAFEAQSQLFDLDAALDRRFYHGFVQLAARQGSPGSGFQQLMELLIDRVNLVWLLRYRFLYELPPSQAYYLLVPSQYRLSSGLLRELSVLNRLQDVLAALPSPYREWLRNAPSVYEAFTIMERKGAEKARTVLRSRAPALARAFAYLVLRERDLRRVRAAIKGARIGLDPGLIRQAMGLAEVPAPAFGREAA
jgi:V/A-type H+-transporting ATPase subunit C